MGRRCFLTSQVSCFIAVLSLAVAALLATLLVPPRLLTEAEDGGDRGETYGAAGVRYRLTRLTDRFG